MDSMLNGMRRLNKTSSGGSGFIGIFDEVFAPTRTELQQETLRTRPSRMSPDHDFDHDETSGSRFSGTIHIDIPRSS
jgi:hypothetical protein